ncbi:MAG: hypothetical protein IJ764_02880 [Bacteroidales bacterium]|nr:hypothetical protein [Bacteroidales bacterium]
MKKFFCYFAAVALALGSLTMSSCGKDDDENNNSTTQSDPVPSGVNDLVGTWTLESESFSTVYTFTATHVTIEELQSHKTESDYTYANGVLTLTNPKSYYYNDNASEGADSWTVDPYDIGETRSVNVTLLQDKSVIVFRTHVPADGDMLAYDEIDFAYKVGKTIPFNPADLYGKWNWMMYGTDNIIRTTVTFIDKTFDLIITAWGQRYKGTFTYDNGYVIFHTEKYFEAAWEDRDEFHPENANWIEEPLENAIYSNTLKMPFFVNGNEAYANVANLPALFEKQVNR